MWGTFEKRLIIGGMALVWLSWMVLQCIWQMWGHGSASIDASHRAYPSPMHRARHVLEPFSTNVVANFVPARDAHNPFYPNPTQPLPPPTPASTRQVTLVYQGHYATSQGEKHAYLLAGTNLVTGPVGTTVIAGFAIVEITPQQLTLADSSGKRITLEFTVAKTIDIPL